MVVLDVDLEVTGEAVDACRQQRHLHFGRSGVTLSALMVRDDLRLLRNRKWHSNSLSILKHAILRQNQRVPQEFPDSFPTGFPALGRCLAGPQRAVSSR